MPSYSRCILRTHITRVLRRFALPLCCAALLLLAACSSAGGATGTPAPGATSTPVVPAISTALVTYKGHAGGVIGLAWSPDGKQIASCGDDGTVQVWEAATGKARWSTTVGRFAFAVAWSPDGTRIVADAGADGALVLLDAASGRQLASFGSQSGFVEGLAWSPDGKQLASGAQDGTVTVWDVSHLAAPVLTYISHSDAVAHVTWSPDGTRLASADDNGVVQVWDAHSGTTLLTYKGNVEPVWSVAWSPDGKEIASGTGAAGADDPVRVNNSVKIWDAASGRTLLTLHDSLGQSYALAWSPDSMRLATSDGKVVHVWDASGRPILQYTGHSDDVFGLAWSPDGALIASASADGTVQVWRPQV